MFKSTAGKRCGFSMKRMISHQICYFLTISATLVVAGIAQSADRIIGLKGQPNFRDIGGYETTDGRKVKNALIYRSGELPKLTDEDVGRLRKLGIKTVINFLTPNEIEWRGKDRLPDGVKTINIPITGDVAGIPDVVNKLLASRKSGDFRKFPPKFNQQIHAELVSGLADKQYAKLFKVLADESNYPLVYHCSHGIHRTGTATALLLTALGVSWETIRQDYLLSNTARQAEIDQRIGELESQAKTISMSEEDRAANSKAIRAFYILQPKYINTSKKVAAKKYGSIENYLSKGLGVSEKETATLRQILTE
jgi:protein-tyrosine phosphatase